MELNLNDPGLNRYLRVYNYYKDLITSGKLEPGVKLPSIRKCSMQLQLSRTTVETAYMLLAAEGYIISRPQSGYYVTEFFASGRQQQWEGEKKKSAGPGIRYDFASSTVDRDSFQFDLWRRYIKSALRQDERLLSYGEPQGEAELREEICRYLSRHRNVVCLPDQIVVGAGVQSLLHILCPMIREREEAYFYNAGFLQGRRIFEDHGFATEDVRAIREKGGLKEKSICYLTPSQMTVWGEVMPISERMDLIREAFQKDILIIEDDYNSEFRYYNRPTPSLQGLAGGKNVVYLGTFSRLLLPSIRMSFMVLPAELLPLYRERGRYYNQTASKAEQIALCQFIRDGHLESQIRKTRKLYTAKAKKLCSEIGAIFGDRAAAHLGEAGFLVLAEIKADRSADEIAAAAAAAGIAVRPVEDAGKTELPLAAEDGAENGTEGTLEGSGKNAGESSAEGTPESSERITGKSAKESGAGSEPTVSGRWPRILLSCASIGAECYEEALTELYRAIFPA